MKTEYRFFTIAEWEEEEEFLRAQHKKGWKFVSAKLPCFYTFEECEPQDVVYQLDYNPQAAESKAEYVQMFRDCGWEYLQDLADYSYFRKPAAEMHGEERIFCDDSSRLEMLDRVFRTRMVPLLIALSLIFVSVLVLLGETGRVWVWPAIGVYAALFILYLSVVIKFLLKYRQMRR